MTAVPAIVVDGTAIVASRPAALVAGSVIVPLDPYLRAVAQGITFDAATGFIVLTRGAAAVVVSVGVRSATLGSRSIALPIAPYLRDGEAFVPLAPLARALGAAVSFDGRTKTVTIALPAAPAVGSPAPFAALPGAPPQVPPRHDPTAAPTPAYTGIPVPRRTPIEAAPSRPYPAPSRSP
jgi:copper amine oxidase-like protein